VIHNSSLIILIRDKTITTRVMYIKKKFNHFESIDKYSHNDVKIMNEYEVFIQ
jgi:hypothetical protein